jgi:hypothetical protein
MLVYIFFEEIIIAIFDVVKIGKIERKKEDCM